MPILKIFRGNIADQLYSEKEIINTKSKDLRVKKAQMNICKRDMEELALAKSLVQVAKNQVYALTQIEDFMEFIHADTNYKNIDIAALFESLNTEYDIEDRYSNLFANFDYQLNNTENLEFKNDNGEVLSLNDYYPWLYQNAQEQYYKLYSEISTHQINISKIANEAIGLIDLRRGEVDAVLAIAKNISESVNKLVDFTTQYFDDSSDKINEIVNDLNEQEQQVHVQYRQNIDEDDSIVPVIFDTTCNQLIANTKSVSVKHNDSVKVIITSNVPGTFTINEQPSINNEQIAKVTISSTGVIHEFTIKNLNESLLLYTIDNISTTFTPTDTSKYQIFENYNILTTDGDAANVSKANLICSIDLQPLEVTQLISIEWKNDETPKYAGNPGDQHYYVIATYQAANNAYYSNEIEIDKDSIEAYKHSDSEQTSVTNFYIIKGQYDLYCQLNDVRTQTPMMVTIL